MAPSTFASQKTRNFNQPHLPSSRSHAQLPSSLNQNHISQRSISASYVSRAPSQQQLQQQSQRFSHRQSDVYGARGRPLPPIHPTTPQKKKSKIDQLKVNLKNKLDLSAYYEWPFDKFNNWSESFDLWDWDAELGYYSGFASNLFHLFIRVLSAIWTSSSSSTLSSNKSTNLTTGGAGHRLNEARQQSKSKFSIDSIPFLWLFSISMCVFSCWNAYRLFTTRRAYQLHYREDMVNSPNAVLVQSPTAPQEEPISWTQTVLNLIKRMSTVLIGWPNTSINQVPKPTQIYQLNVWDINEVRLKVYIVYPPAQAFLIHFCSLTENCLHWTLCMMATIYQVYWIVNSYSQYVKDKAIIQSEVMNEYNTKFVYPKAFPHTREASTMTSSAEFIRREDWMS